MPPRFVKFHGFGNDYIVIEQKDLSHIAPNGEASHLGEFARRICNRHYGAGADGIAVISPPQDDAADFHVRIFNPDGSEAGLSGNGTRCAASYIYYQKLWDAEQLRLSTRSGVKLYTLLDNPGPGRYVFDSELGQPKFDSPSIPLLVEPPLEKVIDYELTVDGATFKVTALLMGNPNCCIFVDDFDELDWRAIGKSLERHQQFPDRTNVVFIRVDDRKTISLRIWERGVGETEASGTCSCAAAVSAMINDKTERLVKVLMPGGEAKIHWRADGEVVITGAAEVIYGGEWLAPGQ
ncbi:MAG TPA: diaminopimelate epimerase [Pyrinomonadaceae bacterium]|nr:diaminopimelate epimerase [Pyrinomonadaceae bacterium]